MQEIIIRVHDTDRRQYEFFNSDTLPRRYIGGKNILVNGFEGVEPSVSPRGNWLKVTIVPYKEHLPDTEWIYELKHHDQCQNGTCYKYECRQAEPRGMAALDEIIRKRNPSGDSLVFYLNEPKKLHIGLVVRVYELDQLDDTTTTNLGEWHRIGDVPFTKLELLTYPRGITKPIFSRASLRFIELAGIQDFNGHGNISIHTRKSTFLRGDGDGDGRAPPVPLYGEIHADLAETMGELITEQRLIDQIPKTDATIRHQKRQYAYPLYHCIPGIPPITDFPVKGFALSKEMTYEYPEDIAANVRIYRTLAVHGSSFFLRMDGWVASKEWYSERLSEVLQMRAMKRETFIAHVRAAKTSKRLTDSFRECLMIISHVARMHCMSRPYRPDVVTLPGYEPFGSDEESMATGLPGDCEDTATTVYGILVGLLFSNIHVGDPMLTALRECAAMMGVPCIVCGTGLESETHDDEEEEGGRKGGIPVGHTYVMVIPFTTFSKQVGLELPVDAFKGTFGFELPKFHTKPAFLDAVDFMTPFWGDLHPVCIQKQIAIMKAHEWTQHYGGYHCSYPLSKVYRRHGHAFRLFTAIFEYMKQWSPYGIYARDMFDHEKYHHYKAEDGIPSSFLVVSNFEESEVESIFDIVYPVVDKRDRIRSDWRKFNGELMYPKHVYETCEENMRQSSGIGKMGVTFDVLAAPKMYEGKPLFMLHAIQCSKSIVEKDREIRRAFDRPLVPLPRHPVDASRSEIIKIQVPPLKQNATPLPSDPNRRLEVFAYGKDLTQLTNAINAIRKQVGLAENSNVMITPYAFSVAIIFELPPPPT